MNKLNPHNSSTTPISGEVRLHETNRIADLQWRDHFRLEVHGVWLLLLTIAVAVLYYAEFF